MNTNTDMNRKPRPTCTNWDEGATVAIRSHGRGWRTERKVVSTGTGELRLPKKYGDSLRRMLRTGLDVHLAFGDEACVRFFACATEDGKRMFVAAQTMGTFRTATYDGLVVSYTSEKGARKIPKAEAMKRFALSKMPRAQRAEGCPERDHVTPETVVACPRCGYEFKVGRSLV